ncbi:MAG: hypothetical protein EU530_09540 [Promethearchaeota archaeon]|nr:MAG: hypothetical protein EU530_09540 [Candidatus Lokiarchaeota archaeon]
MGMKPPDPDILSVFTYWDSPEGLKCPLCETRLEYAFNDGGRILVTLKGKLWVVQNYYRCLNSDCSLHKAFPMVHESVVKNKKFGKDVWERVILRHFKYHLDHSQIQGMFWDEDDVSISKSTIRNICNHFEHAGREYVDQNVLSDIQASGQILLSLDGAQPTKGRSALWIFTDRITKHTIHAELLHTASATVLSKIMAGLEEKYGVPIKAVISDKQRNIVNAVKRFNPNIKHAYCQYHFLNHIMEPIQAKDSHIATQMRKSVRKFSILLNLYKASLPNRDPEFNPLYHSMEPLANEILNAIAVSGKKWEVFPGKEIYENLSYIKSMVDIVKLDNLSQKIVFSLESVKIGLDSLLIEYKPLYDEVISLLNDTSDLRKQLGRSRNSAKTVKKAVKSWVYRLQKRLERLSIEFKPENLKFVQSIHSTNLNTIWQQWTRLEHSYHEGLYYSYDFPEIEKTNNATEQLINRTKRHFRMWLGHQAIQEAFEQHGENYAHLLNLNLSKEQIHEILWKQSVAFAEGNTTPWEYFQPVLNRNWRIQEVHTGNWERLHQNLDREKKT